MVRKKELGWLSLAALLSAAARGAHTYRFAGKPGLIDPYWNSFFYMTFAQGFRRRALVGSLLAGVLHHPPSYLLLNVLCLAVIGAMLAIFGRSVVKVTRVGSWTQAAMLVALLSGCLVTPSWEVFGDLLQVDLLVFFLAAIVLCAVPSQAIRLLAGTSVLVAAFFVHEASLFLLAPFLPFLLKRRPRFSQYALVGSLAVLLLGLALLWSRAPVTSTSTPVQQAQPAQQTAGTPEAPPPLPVLLRSEVKHDLGSVRLQLAFASRIVRILLVLSAALVAIGQVLPADTFLLYGRVFQTALLFSLPLWLIAHDWGRFTSYLVMLSFVITSLHSQSDPGLTPEPGSPESVPALAKLATRVGQYWAVQVAAVAVLLFAPGFEARVSGMSLRGLLASSPFVLFALWQMRQARSSGMVAL